MRRRLLALESTLDPYLVEVLIGGILILPAALFGAAAISWGFSPLLSWVLLAFGCVPPFLLFIWILTLLYRLPGERACAACYGKGYTVNERLMCLEPCRCRDEEEGPTAVNTHPRSRTSGLAERAIRPSSA